MCGVGGVPGLFRGTSRGAGRCMAGGGGLDGYLGRDGLLGYGPQEGLGYRVRALLSRRVHDM